MSFFPTQQPAIVNGYPISPDFNMWGVVVPEGSKNLFPDPSFEGTVASAAITATNAVKSLVTTQQSRGTQSLQIAPSSVALSEIYYQVTPASLGVVANTIYAWSLDVLVPTGEQMQITVRDGAGTAFYGTKNFKAYGGQERVFLTWNSPIALPANLRFYLTKIGTIQKNYFTDGWQLENKNYPTSYIDGNQFGCIWNGVANSSTSSRVYPPVTSVQQSIGGRYYGFNDLGLQVMGFQNAGMPVHKNVTTPYGILGGQFLQRTTISERVIILNCRAQTSRGLLALQQIRENLINLLGADISTQDAPRLFLRYQNGDRYGASGPILEIPVVYAGGLEGNTDNLYAEQINLQFLELAPPGIKELFDQYALLPNPNTAPAGYVLMTRTSDGTFTVSTSVSQYTALHYDQTKTLWNSNYTVITNGTASQALNSAALAITSDLSNNIYAGGAFTTPTNYVIQYNGTTWSAMGAVINGTVRALGFTNQGALIAGGDFAAPVARLGQWTGATWVALGTGANASVRALVLSGKDGYLYIMGDFTTLNGVSNVRVGRYKNGSYGTAMGTGITGGAGQVWCGAVGPDGKLYVGGDFTFAGGVNAVNIAVWNGTTWAALGSNTLTGLVETLSFDDLGNLVVGGQNLVISGLGLSYGGFKWTGSNWLPIDVSGGNSAVEISVTASNKTKDAVAYSFTPGASVALYPAVTNVTNNGNVNVYPRFIINTAITGIYNYTTKKGIYFSFTLIAGDYLVLETDPKIGLSLTSFLSGDVFSYILPGSDLGTFSLAPGLNRLCITGFQSGTGTTVTYKNGYFSIEGVV